MSFYPFGTSRSGLKTASRQQLTINSGQLLRTLLIFVAAVLALGFAARQGHARNGLEPAGAEVGARKAGVVISGADIGLINIRQ